MTGTKLGPSLVDTLVDRNQHMRIVCVCACHFQVLVCCQSSASVKLGGFVVAKGTCRGCIPIFLQGILFSGTAIPNDQEGSILL
jgi:hypothetical protein